MEGPGRERGKPEVKRGTGRFLDNVTQAAEVGGALGAGAVAAWLANYQVDIPMALTIGAGAMVAVGSVMTGLEVARQAAFRADSERRMKETFSREPDKYVPLPVDADGVIRRLEQGKK
ncbi:MAG: hypothetical protein AAB548_02675 [Patescibacteria group bacterium]